MLLLLLLELGQFFGLAGEELQTADSSVKCVLAYLILIGINKNEQRVKAVAANYRKVVSRKCKVPNMVKPHTDAAASIDVDSEPMPITLSDSRNC